MIRLLVVDDSALMRRLLGSVFRDQGDFEVTVARDGVEALRLLHEVRPDVVTLDVNMPNMDGLGCLDRIMLERPSPVVMVSSLTTEGADVTLEAMQLGAVDFVAKPEGAVTLSMVEWAPLVVEKVRMAARARPRPSRRLAERVRLRAVRDSPAPPPPAAAVPGPAPAVSLAQLPRDSVVLVGTSTGGPPALEALLSPLPADFPWPVLVAQHMPGTFTGPLARRLDRLCALNVVEVTRAMTLAPGRVYIGRGDGDILVGMRPAGPVVLAAPADGHRWHPSVDRMVTTALLHLGGARLIGVLMTGMGNDGAESMARLRAEGGRTIAQSEDTAVVWGMPGELVRAGGAQLVVPLEQIAPTLLGWRP